MEQALRLSPRDSRAGNWCARIGLAYLLQSRTDQAILWLEKAASASPDLPYVHAFLASACGLKCETCRAVAEVAEARRLSSESSYSSITRMRAMEYLEPALEGGRTTRPAARPVSTAPAALHRLP